jgi:hypothetical protein
VLNSVLHPSRTELTKVSTFFSIDGALAADAATPKAMATTAANTSFFMMNVSFLSDCVFSTEQRD